ncbi:hypothetical protein [Nonomuraea sp. NPDC050786]|uniref:hypothetical protein n=1 Tax=Nonomuraea sp. NPDC050786 TaxID=3154840 RepID=UPI0033F7E470
MAPPPQHQDAPERKSSKAVVLTVLGALSVTMVAVWAIAESNDDDVTADCVLLVEEDTPTLTTDGATPTPDPGSYQVVDDSYCDDDDNNSSYRLSNGGSHGAYHWYYGGTRRGDRVYNGSTYRPSDVTISSRSGKEIQRGGFGNRWSSGS